VPNVEKPMVLTSFWINRKTNRLLLIMANYEAEPLDDATIKLNTAKLGLKGTLYAEDAVTLEPIAVSADGVLKLDVLGERYRMIKVSNEPARFRNDVLGANLVTDAPAQVDKSWTSGELKLDPNSMYVISAQIKIDQPIGAASADPNKVGAYGPAIAHHLSIQLTGDGVNGVNGTNKITLASADEPKPIPYRETQVYRRSFTPLTWEKTAGWVTYFVVVGTASNTASGKIAVNLTDAGQAQVKEISLRKVK
jgi:hypothetical protein